MGLHQFYLARFSPEFWSISSVLRQHSCWILWHSSCSWKMVTPIVTTGQNTSHKKRDVSCRLAKLWCSFINALSASLTNNTITTTTDMTNRYTGWPKKTLKVPPFYSYDGKNTKNVKHRYTILLSVPFICTTFGTRSLSTAAPNIFLTLPSISSNVILSSIVSRPTVSSRPPNPLICPPSCSWYLASADHCLLVNYIYLLTSLWYIHEQWYQVVSTAIILILD